MNIFVLSNNPFKCASYTIDRHVVKMILESAQLLSTAHRVIDGNKVAESRVPNILRATHINHPCSIWVRECSGNYYWLHMLMYGLCFEYTKRYGKIHKYSNPEHGHLLEQLLELPEGIKDGPRTKFVLVMPDEYWGSNIVKSYRDYYFGDKREMASWKEPATIPKWWTRRLKGELR